MTQPIADVEVKETLDCTGLLCPLPVYKAGVILQRLDPGDVLKVVTTDPGALEDIPALARQRGDTLLGSEGDDRVQTFWLRKGS
ncbi:MAG: sulfurtransferase TusA family protein [Actinomycetota bacterium]